MTKSNTSKIKQVLTAGLVFVSRLKVLPANFSALGSFGFFGQNLWLYMATVILFDSLVGGFYIGFLYTYVGFLGYYVLGKIARDDLKKQVILLPMASLLFFLISNFGVWWGWYAHTWAGLVRCYLLAVPFYRNTLLGDLVFGYGFLLVKSLAKKNYFSKFTKLLYA